MANRHCDCPHMQRDDRVWCDSPLHCMDWHSARSCRGCDCASQLDNRYSRRVGVWHDSNHYFCGDTT